ncbi:MAG: hypothetical protein AAAC47_11290 [Pararhizobium sp.]
MTVKQLQTDPLPNYRQAQGAAMTDPTIEAAARALMIADVHLTQANAERVATAFTPIIEAAVTPLIRAADAKLIEENVADLVAMTRAAALEEAALALEGETDMPFSAEEPSYVHGQIDAFNAAARVVRALKEQP